MEQFKSNISSRHSPTVALYPTLECDAVVRTVSTHRSLTSLLSNSQPQSQSVHPIRINEASSLQPLKWLSATQTLETSLHHVKHTKPPSHLVTTFQNTLEDVTAIANHEYLSIPVLSVLAAWVGEQHIVDNLKAVSTSTSHSKSTSVDSTISSTPSTTSQTHVLLVLRDTSRQDEAARQQAMDLCISTFGKDRVHLLRLPSPDPPASNSPPAIASALTALAQEALAATVDTLSRTVRSLRASRSSLRSWFTGQPAGTTTIPLRPPPTESTSPDRRRRLSVSGGAHTPLFPPDSLEALSRRLADLLFLSRRYTSALEEYALLLDDFRSLQGATLVHCASAREMLALSRALANLPRQTVGAGLELAVQEYARADRRELAARAALRAAHFCLAAGFPDSAAGVLVRAMPVIEPPRHMLPTVITSTTSLPRGNASFIDAIMGVLCAATCDAFVRMGRIRRRRASLYAYLAAGRFARLKQVSAAACVAAVVDDKALIRAPVREDVDLMLASAEATDGMYPRAARLFAGVLGNSTQQTDLEVQGTAVRGLLSAVAAGADKTFTKRWDTGILFPLVLHEATTICTYDAGEFQSDKMWNTLDDDVLQDYEFFRALEMYERSENAPIPKRAEKVETLVAELRKTKELRAKNDPGGSLEMKIKRMREIAEAKMNARRKRSLIERGAVVNEEIVLKVSMRNPLPFPIFVGDLCAVVSFNEKVYSSPTSFPSTEEGEEETENAVKFCPSEDITIGPCSTVIISLKVLVTKPGSLKFLGMTWNFSFGITSQSQKLPECNVRGFCFFEKKGRRLNKTRKQRASEIPLYEEDLSLTLAIAPEAPKLKTWLVTSDDSSEELDINSHIFRAGEKRSAWLVIENQGKNVAENIVIRIGTPQTAYLPHSPDNFQQGEEQYMYAVGVNDGHVKQKEFIVSSRMTVNLEMGEQKRIPICLRAAVPRSAFGYRSGLKGMMKVQKPNTTNGDVNLLNDDGSVWCAARIVIAYGTEQTRLSRLSMQFRVRPSILVSPRFLREADPKILSGLGKDLSGVLIGVEVEHACDTQEDLVFDITSLAVTSRSEWKPMHLPIATSPTNTPKAVISAAASRLRVNETATYFILIVQENSEADELVQASTETPKSWKTFVVKGNPSNMTGEAVGNDDVFDSNKSSEMDDLTFVALNAATNFALYSSPHVEKSGTVGHSVIDNQVFLSVGWTSSAGSSGDIHILPINPLRWMTQKTSPTSSSTVSSNTDQTVDSSQDHEREKELIEVRVLHPKSLVHDFFPPDKNANVGKADIVVTAFPAVVPVDVYVRNTSSILLDVIFGAPTGGGVADGDHSRFWTGDVEMSLRSIPPGVERVLRLSAVLTKPGKHNLSRFSISCQTSGFTPIRTRKLIDVTPSYLELEASENSILDEENAECLRREIESLIVSFDKGTKISNLSSQRPPRSGKSVAQNESGAHPKVRIANYQLSKSVSTTNIHPSPSEKPMGKATWFSSLRRSASGLVRNQVSLENDMGISSSPDKTLARQPTKSPKKSVEDADWNTSDTDESES